MGTHLLVIKEAQLCSDSTILCLETGKTMHKQQATYLRLNYLLFQQTLIFCILGIEIKNSLRNLF